jgi:hypothetical protein
MLRIRFYNRRLAHEHPSRKHLLRRLSAERRGKPAGAEVRDPPRSGAVRPSFVVDAGPPRGHPASDGRVLDGTPPASIRTGIVARARAQGGESAAAFSAARRLAVRTSDASLSIGDGSARALLSSTADPASTRSTSMLPAFTGSEAPSAGEVQIEYPRGHSPGAPCPLAGGRGCCTCSSRFENSD